MESTVAKVDHIILSLSPEEAEMLKAILNVSHDSVTEQYPCDGETIEQFSRELWRELDSWEVKDTFA